MIKSLLVLGLLLELIDPVKAQFEHVTRFTGIWTLDLAKSSFRPGPPFQSFTITFTLDGTRKLDLIGADGQHLNASLPWSDGKEVPVAVTAGKMENVTAASTMRGRTFNDIWRENGRIIEKVHGVVSSDGASLAVTVHGTDRQGRAFHNHLKFEKR